MEVSPIAPEFFGQNPKIIIINSGPVSKRYDLAQQCSLGADRKGLIDLFKSYELDFMMTFLVKCTASCDKPKNPLVKNIRVCSKWLDIESANKFKIGLGTLVKTYYKCDEYLPALPKLFESKTNIDLLKKVLEKYKNDHS